MTDRERATVILEGAIEILENEGWIQRTLANDSGHCMIGALTKSTHVNNGTVGEYRLSRAAVSAGVKVVSGFHYYIPYFNDLPSRTKSDVILAMKHGLDYLKPGQSIAGDAASIGRCLE